MSYTKAIIYEFGDFTLKPVLDTDNWYLEDSNNDGYGFTLDQYELSALRDILMSEDVIG